MARMRTGSAVLRKFKKNNKVTKVWYARITYIEEGRRKQRWRRAESKTDAKEIAKQLLRELDDHGGKTLDSAQMTFVQLADYFKTNYIISAQYANDRKVAGMRSAYDMELKLNILKQHFGKKRIRQITFGDLEHFKAVRLRTKTKNGGQRSIATANRELSLLRRVFNVAVQNGWMLKSPFNSGSIITPGDELPRQRVITREEEERLIAACTGRREHIRPIVICAIDTGMRRGEILTLKWSDVDFDNSLIIIRAFNTKTMRERQVAITGRLAGELQAVYGNSTKEPDALVFGITNNVKKAFNSARKLAGLLDVRFHDLRHTHATRLVAANISLSEVGRILGHTQANTTYRYVNANVETARRAAAAIDEFNKVQLEGQSTVIH
jgi:integrase